MPLNILPTLARRLAWLSLLAPATAALACSDLPVGRTLSVRLTAPISTASAKPGDPVHAVLTGNLVCDSDVVLPMGTPIDGIVRSRRKVGFGIRHETAALELEFTDAKLVSGEPLSFVARVQEVENARELVRNGIIQGIRSSDTFQGRINSRLIHLPTWNPYSDPVLIIYKAVFPIFPEPEIYLPAGTDLRLRTSSEISCPPSPIEFLRGPVPVTASDTPQASSLLVSALPTRVVTAKHVPADLINLVFLGSEDTVRAAFRLAGWDSADPVTRRSVAKNFYALLDNSGYAREPMTTFYLNGRPEDMNWQRSLNSYDRRDHLRIWRWPAAPATTTAETPHTSVSSTTQAITPTPAAAQTVWLSSSTHDTGAILAVKYRGFVHHITPDIDEERATVIRDLDFAGCIQSVAYVGRPDVPTTTRNATGDPMHTDGSVAVVTLQTCQPTSPRLDPAIHDGHYKSGNIVFRFVRRQILTFRSDIWRANIIYGAYDLGRMSFSALRPARHEHSTGLAARPQPQPPPAPSPSQPLSPDLQIAQASLIDEPLVPFDISFPPAPHQAAPPPVAGVDAPSEPPSTYPPVR